MTDGVATARPRAASGRFASARHRHDSQSPVLHLLWRGLHGRRAGMLLLTALPQPCVQREPPHAPARLPAAVALTTAAPSGAPVAPLYPVRPDIHDGQYPRTLLLDSLSPARVSAAPRDSIHM